MNTRLLIAALLGITALASGCANSKQEDLSQNKMEQGSLDAKVIYGDDHRLEHYQASEKFKTLAKSTVALLKKNNLIKRASGEYQISGKNFGSSNNLCASEPFREQTAAAFCSGSLVAPDVIMTAGHCIRTTADCANVQFVFDFQLSAAGVETKKVTADDIYSCAEIIHTEMINTGADFALIKLDRKVVGRSALKLREKEEIKIGDNLVVIGHPVGLPQKIAGGAQVRSLRPEHFVANLDTYGGNSGSAVFNADTGLVEGILVRGENDFTQAGSCVVSYRCKDDNCRGEDVTRIAKVLEYLPASGEEPGPSEPQIEKFSNTAKVVIPDNVPAGIISVVSTGASAPASRKVSVTVDIAHSWRGDLLLELTAPSGKKIVLHNRSGGSLDHIQGTFGEDLSSAQDLASLSQESAGLWSLKVSDHARADQGILNSWSLTFK